jgi:hypothetical protein
MNFDLLGRAFGTVIEFLDRRATRSHDREMRTQELESVRHERVVQNIREGRAAETDWNINAQNNSGWRDEAVTILLSIPLLLCFIPGGDVYVVRGFQALEQTPLWFQGAIMLMIASAFGYQAYARVMGNRTPPTGVQSNP